MDYIKRSERVNTFCVYLILSILYFYVCYCLQQNQSAFEVNNLYLFALKYKWSFLVTLVSAGLIFNIYSFALELSLISVFSIGIQILILSLANFDRVLLVLLFLYVVLSFFFILQITEELNQPYYKLKKYRSRLLNRTKLKFNCIIESRLENGQELVAQLIDWNEKGCSILLVNEFKVEFKKLNFTIDFNGHQFSNVGTVLAKDGQLLGIKFDTENRNFAWKDLYEVLYDYGHESNYIN